MTKKENKLIVIVGPSGSGKTYLSNQLKEHGIPKCVTATTRAARSGEGEVDGQHYYFLTKEEFDSTTFVETTTYNSNSYGTPIDEIYRKLDEFGKTHVVVDQSGAEKLKKMFPAETIIVYLPISESQMRERMVGRGDDESDIEERVAYAHKTGEFELMNGVDYIYNVFEESKLDDLIAFIG